MRSYFANDAGLKAADNLLEDGVDDLDRRDLAEVLNFFKKASFRQWE